MKKTEINHDVRRDYARYERIRTARKRLEEEVLKCDPSKTHKTHQVGNAVLHCDGEDEECALNVDLNVEQRKSFRFRLFCKEFTPGPCVHFDSDGCAHESPPSPDCHLRRRMVRTPHFHRYDEQGRNIPYRTQALEANEDAILCNVRRALDLFSEEENCEVPTLALQGALYEQFEFPDPLKEVPFP